MPWGDEVRVGDERVEVLYPDHGGEDVGSGRRYIDEIDARAAYKLILHRLGAEEWIVRAKAHELSHSRAQRFGNSEPDCSADRAVPFQCSVEVPGTRGGRKKHCDKDRRTHNRRKNTSLIFC